MSLLQATSFNRMFNYSRDCTHSISVFRATPFLILMDRDQLDNACAAECKAHEEEHIDERMLRYMWQARRDRH
jgi:hypothetical protein